MLTFSPSNIDQIAPATPLPPPRGLTPRPLNERENQLVSYLGRLQFVSQISCVLLKQVLGYSTHAMGARQQSEYDGKFSGLL